jgi:hypothetical protein
MLKNKIVWVCLITTVSFSAFARNHGPSLSKKGSLETSAQISEQAAISAGTKLAEQVLEGHFPYRTGLCHSVDVDSESLDVQIFKYYTLGEEASMAYKARVLFKYSCYLAR